MLIRTESMRKKRVRRKEKRSIVRNLSFPSRNRSTKKSSHHTLGVAAVQTLRKGNCRNKGTVTTTIDKV